MSSLSVSHGIFCFVSIILLLFFPPVKTFGGSAPGNNVNSLHDGSWALQFHFRDSFNDGDFPRFIVSGKRHFTERSALRFGFGFDFSYSDADFMGGQNKGGAESSGYNLDFTFEYLYYPSNGEKLNLLLGIGPFFKYEWGDFERLGQTGYILRSESETTALGLSTAIGLEYFMKQNVSFITELGILLEYNMREITGETTDAYNQSEDSRSTAKYDIFEFSPLFLKLGLSFYL